MRRSLFVGSIILLLFLHFTPQPVVQADYYGPAVCGTLERSPQPSPDPFGQNLGVGPTFKPFGWSDSSQWLEFHPLGVYVEASNDYDFFDFPDTVSLWIYDAQVSGNTVYQISRYELVDSCAPQVSFYPDREGITAGECTNLYWQVDNTINLEGVYFQGDRVDSYGAAQVCPTESTHYQLQVRSYDNWSNDYWVRIYVAPAPTSAPPTEIPYQPPTNTPQVITQPQTGNTEVSVPAIAQRFSPGDRTSTGQTDRGDYDCLAASTAMVLQALQNQGKINSTTAVDYATVRQAYRRIKPNPLSGLGNDDAVTVTNQLTGGVISAHMYTVPFADWKSFLTAEIASNRPVIISIMNWNLLPAQWSGVLAHSIVAYGFHDDTVYFVDPWDGNRYSQSSNDFVNAWSNGGSNLFLVHFNY